MRIWRSTLYNKRGGFRRVPPLLMPSPRFRGRLPSPPVFCPAQRKEIAFAFCLECPEFRVWSAQDGDFRRCRHEFLSLAARGFYDGTWDDHPENFDAETFEQLQEEKRIRERVLAEMEAEREQLERMAEELESGEEADEKEETEEGDDE